MKKITKKSTKMALNISASVLLVLMLVITIIGSVLGGKRTPPKSFIDNLSWSIDKWDGESDSNAWQTSSTFAKRGTGTFTINSAEEFVNFINLTNNETELAKRNNFKNTIVYLNSNIDLNGQEIDAIQNFEGTFDGSYYTIFNAKIRGTGLFANTKNAEIKNLGLYNVNITTESQYLGALVGTAENTLLSNTYARLGELNGDIVGGLIGKSITNTHITNSFASLTLSGTSVSGLVGNADDSLTLDNCYYTGAKRAVDNNIIDLTSVLSNPNKNQFTLWDYTKDYDLTHTWNDYTYRDGSTRLDFSLPVLSLFNKVFMTGSGYESVIVKDGVSTPTNNISISGAFAEVGNLETAEINIIVEKIYLEEEATAVSGSNITLNTAVETTIVRGNNTPANMVVGEAGSTLTLGDSTSTPAEYDKEGNLITPASNTPKLILDGEKERVEYQGKLTGSLVYSVGKDFTMYSNVTLQNNVNNNGTHYGGGVFLLDVETGAEEDKTVVLHGGTIINCHAQYGGGTSIVRTNAEVNNLEISYCSGSGSYFSDDLAQDMVDVTLARELATRHGLKSTVRPLSGKDSKNSFSTSSNYSNCSGVTKVWNPDKNKSYGGGCCLHTWYGNATLTYGAGTISSCSADFGGGLAATDNDTGSADRVYISITSNAHISYCTANYSGGGVFCRGKVTLSYGNVLHNTAKYGGGICVAGHAGTQGIEIGSNGTVQHNKATSYGGGIMYIYDETATSATSSSGNDTFNYLDNKGSFSCATAYVSHLHDNTINGDGYAWSANSHNIYYPSIQFGIQWWSSTSGAQIEYRLWMDRVKLPSSEGSYGSSYGTLHGFNQNQSSTYHNHNKGESVYISDTDGQWYYPVWTNGGVAKTETGTASQTVTFNANGGKFNSSSSTTISSPITRTRTRTNTETTYTSMNGAQRTTVSYGTWGNYVSVNISTPTDVYRTGYFFNGWASSSSATDGIRYSYSMPVTSSVGTYYLYAVWAKLPTINMSDYTYLGTMSEPTISDLSSTWWSSTVSWKYRSSSSSTTYYWSNVTSSTYLTPGTYYIIAGLTTNGYNDKLTSIEKQFTVYKATGYINPSKTNVSLTYPNSTIVSWDGHGGSVSAQSLNSNIASATANVESGTGGRSGTVAITSKPSAGSGIIRLTSAETTYYTSATSDITVNVSKGSFNVIPDGSGVYTFDGTAKKLYVRTSIVGFKVEYGATTAYGITATSNGEANTRYEIGSLTDAGSKTVYYRVTCPGYNDVTGSVSLTINKADLSPLVNFEDYAYDSAVSTPSVSGNNGNGSVEYYINTTNSNSGGTPISEITPTSMNVGTYYIYATIAETTNYNSAITSVKSFNITKGTRTLEVSMLDYTYADTKSEPTITGNKENGAVTYYFNTNNSSLNGTAWSNVLDATSLNAGTYYMYAVVGETTNYSLSTSDTTSFVINRADIIPTVTMSDFTYGSNVNTQLLPSVNGNLGNATVTYYYNTTDTNTEGIPFTNVTNILPVGRYYIYAIVSQSTNYNSATTPTTSFNVTKNTLLSVTCEWSNEELATASWTESSVSGIVVTYEVKLYKNNELVETLTTTSLKLNLVPYIRTHGAGDYAFTVTAKSGSLSNCNNSEASDISTSLHASNVSIVIESGIDATIAEETSYIMIAGETNVEITANTLTGGDFIIWTASSEDLSIENNKASTTTISLAEDTNELEISLTPTFGKQVTIKATGLIGGEIAKVNVFKNAEDANNNVIYKIIEITENGEIVEWVRKDYILKIEGKTISTLNDDNTYQILVVYINNGVSPTVHDTYETGVGLVGDGVTIEFKFALAYKTTISTDSEISSDLASAMQDKVKFEALDKTSQVTNSNTSFTANDADVKLTIDTSFLNSFEGYDFVGFTYQVGDTTKQTWNLGNLDFAKIQTGNNVIYEYNKVIDKPVENITILLKQRVTLTLNSDVADTWIRSADGLERQLSKAGTETLYAGVWTLLTNMELSQVENLFNQPMKITSKGDSTIKDTKYKAYEIILEARGNERVVEFTDIDDGFTITSSDGYTLNVNKVGIYTLFAGTWTINCDIPETIEKITLALYNSNILVNDNTFTI